jgi:hypothetical protein
MESAWNLPLDQPTNHCSKCPDDCTMFRWLLSDTQKTMFRSFVMSQRAYDKNEGHLWNLQDILLYTNMVLVGHNDSIRSQWPKKKFCQTWKFQVLFLYFLHIISISLQLIRSGVLHWITLNMKAYPLFFWNNVHKFCKFENCMIFDFFSKLFSNFCKLAFFCQKYFKVEISLKFASRWVQILYPKKSICNT